MNNKNNTYKILRQSSFLSSTCQLPTFNSNIHISRSLLGVGYFYLPLEQSACKPSKLDYIEAKTTTGGKTMILSMYRSTLLAIKNILAILTSNQDLNLANSDLKLNNVRTLFIPEW